jgi:hypothetical protein
VTELPLEVAGLVFDRLAAKDLISLRLVDEGTCVYVAAYWEQIKPLYRQRQTELVVELTDGQDVERFVQGRTICVSKWRLQEQLFIASCNITASNVVPTPVLKSVKSLRLNGKRRSFSQLQQAAAATEADCVGWSGLLGNAQCLPALQRLELINVTGVPTGRYHQWSGMHGMIGRPVKGAGKSHGHNSFLPHPEQSTSSRTSGPPPLYPDWRTAWPTCVYGLLATMATPQSLGRCVTSSSRAHVALGKAHLSA